MKNGEFQKEMTNFKNNKDNPYFGEVSFIKLYYYLE